MGMKIAFYKGTDSGFSGILDRLVRWWTNGPYSHCELIFSDGWAGSASWSDDGVVLNLRKEGYYSSDKWDIVEIDGDEVMARKWFREHLSCSYDLLGDFGFVWRPIKGDDKSYFCSEAIAEALGWPMPWRFDPNTQAAVVAIPKYI